MKKKPSKTALVPQAKITALVQNLRKTELRLQELTEVDAVIHPGGHAYLLYKAQQKLRESEAAQRELAQTQLAILNAMPAHVALVDSQGVILSVNNAWRRFATGNAMQGPEFFLGQNYLEICERATGDCADDAHAAAAGIRRVLQGEVNEFNVEYPCHSPTEQKWFRLLVTRVREDRLSGAVVMHSDITSRKLAEDALRKSEEQFRNMFIAAATGIAISTPHGRYLQANEAYCRMLGYTEKELLTRTFASVTHPEDLTLNLKMRDEMLAGQRDSFVMEKRYLKKNGDIVWTSHSVSATRGAGGEISTLVVVAEDITERKNAAEQLLWKTTLLEAELNSTPDGILIVGTDGKTILQNQRLIDLWNIPEAFAIGVGNSQRLDLVTGQVKNSSQFEEKVKWLYAHPDEISRDEIELINGKYLDRYSAPVQGPDGKHYGRIWSFRDITERKRAEAERQQQQTELQVLFDLMPAKVWLKDTENGIVRINRRAAEATGRPVEELEGKSMYEIYPEEAAKYYADDLEIIKSRTPKLEIIDTLRSPEGRPTWVQTDKVPVLERDGKVYGIVVMAQDITERKEAEARIRRLIDSNVQGVFFWNTRGAITGCNDSFLQMVGYSREDLAAGRLGWKELTPPEFVEADQLALAEIAARGVCAPYEKEYIRRDGSRVSILIGAATFEDNPNEGICFTVDLTERKRSEARTRRLIDSNVQGVVFGNARGQITEANDAFLQMVGYSRADLHEGRIRWQEITPPEYAPLDQRASQEIAEKGICQAYEKEYIRKDGSRVPVLIGGACFEDSPEEGVRFVVDLTERKKLEQQFFRAQRMESIGTLAGGIAHDLNNILAPILMSIHLLKDLAGGPEAQEILETIEISAKRGADIVRQVLSFARGVEGERIEVQPRHLLKDLEHIIKDTFPKDIQLKFFVPENAWMIFGDPTQIHQILLNLCVNARDAMPNGGNLTISVENCVLDEQYVSMNLQAKAGRYVQISVTDAGTGMPREIIDKIFEPFFTTKELTKGTGLGLSTVMAIVKSHEGLVNVYSEPGKGTTFKVYLPAADASSPGGKQVPGKVAVVRGNGETILLVDDETSIITITTKTLESFGYRVLTAGDGAEGVAMFAANQEQIAVVLTDITMPVMDGVAMIHALRRIDPAVKVIAASGLNANGSTTRVSVPGIKHFLTKPYTAETLLRVLRLILDETSTGPSS